MPEEVTFQTKPAIALALLDQARDLGIPHACVTADADYGDNPNFLDGLDIRKERHVVAVRCDFAVAAGAAGRRRSGPTRWSPPRASGRGGPSTGVKGARAGWVGGSWRSAAGGCGRTARGGSAG